MSIVLHRIDVDPDARQLTIHIQFSVASPIEARRAGYEWDGKKFRLSPEDDLIEHLEALSTQAGLRRIAYLAELLHYTMHAVEARYPLSYPIAITGTLLKPSRRSPWAKFKASLRLLFPRQTQKL